MCEWMNVDSRIKGMKLFEWSRKVQKLFRNLSHFKFIFSNPEDICLASTHISIRRVSASICLIGLMERELS